MDDHQLLERARAKRDAAAAELKRWTDFSASLEELIADAGRSPASRASEIISAVARRSSSNVVADTEAAAYRLIATAGHPIPTRDLIPRIKEEGIPIGGKDEIATLSARLSRADSLENVRPYGWKLKNNSAEQSALNEFGEPEGSPNAEEAPTSSADDLWADNAPAK